MFSARAGLALLRAGILPGRRVALVGRGAFTVTLSRELGAALAKSVEDVERVEAALGTQSVNGLRFTSGESTKKLDALLFDAPEPPAFELAAQAGARVHFESELGYVLERSDAGELSENAFALGRLSARADGSRVEAEAVARRLSAR